MGSKTYIKYYMHTKYRVLKTHFLRKLDISTMNEIIINQNEKRVKAD